VFETVFSDPAFLKRAVECGYTVVLCFIGISSPEISEERVAMRASLGGHDVPGDKLLCRYARSKFRQHGRIARLASFFPARWHGVSV
jgi:predicted ABC-type ATPase